MNPVILADSRFLDGTPVASETATGYDVLNIRDLRTYTWWKATTAGTKYISVDAGAVLGADALAVAGHNLGTAGATVSVESSATGAWAGEEVERLSPVTILTDKAFLKPFTLATARYWRVKIVASVVVPKIAVALLGERITFPYPPESPYVPSRERVEADCTRSKAGQLLGCVVRFKPFEITPEWRLTDRAWFETYILPFWREYYGNLAPFFWAWDLDAYPEDARFVKAPDDVEFDPSVSILSRYDRFQLPMEGVLE